MRRPKESYISPAGIIPTLSNLGILGVVPIGALAWNTYPPADSPSTAKPGIIDGTDGPPVGLIASDTIATPYYVTHINGTENTRDGGRIGRWKIQDHLGVNKRIFRFQNPAKQTSAVRFGISIVQEILPISMPPNYGVRYVLAIDNDPNRNVQHKLYATALLVPPNVVPSLLAVAPTAQGAVLPTTAAGTVLTAAATSWVFGSYVQLTAGLGTGALVTSVTVSSAATSSGQVAFATGAGGSEVDWGIFGWAEPIGSTLTPARYNLSPFPLYLPASTRLAARVRGNDPSSTFNVGLEYIPIPLR